MTADDYIRGFALAQQAITLMYFAIGLKMLEMTYKVLGVFVKWSVNILTNHI